MNSFPANFEALAKQGGNSAAGGYPYQIKGSDLMRNFVHAALDTEENLVETISGINGYSQRKLKISAGTSANQIYFWDGSKMVTLDAPPSVGTHVLGAKDGSIQWLATEEC